MTYDFGKLFNKPPAKDKAKPAAPRFRANEVVKHRNGSTYRILLTPREGLILEKTNESAYAYKDPNQNLIWVRSQKEMEDGRFVSI